MCDNGGEDQLLHKEIAQQEKAQLSSPKTGKVMRIGSLPTEGSVEAVDAPDVEMSDEEDFNELIDKKETEYGVTGYRWIALLAFMCMILAHLQISLGFSTYTKQLQIAYGLDEPFWPVAMVDINNILFVPMTFVASKMFKMFDFYWVMVFMSLFQAITCWLRFFSVLEWQFSILFITQCVALSSSAFFMNSISEVVNRWFGANERGLATALISLAITLGTIIALVMTGVAAIGMNKDDQADCQRVLKTILWMDNISITILSLLGIALFRGKPKIPPSKASFIARESTLSVQ